MRPIDTSAHTRIASRDAPPDDDSGRANQFGDSLRAAAHRAGAAGPAPAPTPSMQRDAAARDRDAEAPRASAPLARAVQERPVAALDPRDARLRAHATAHDCTAQRSARRHADTPQPPEGIALQTLLAAAHPLLAGAGDGAAATAPAPCALTPQDVAASVTQAWLREPSTHDVAGVDGSARWTFTLGDPLTPLAALHISGDPTAGWGLQLTAGNGLPARELAAHTERLRRRLRARGQAVDRLEVDDDPQR
jgi:hypothetical protein